MTAVVAWLTAVTERTAVVASQSVHTTITMATTAPMEELIDDLIYGGSERFLTTVIRRLFEKVKCDPEETGDFVYCNIRYKWNNGEISMGQKHYVDMLEPMKLTDDIADLT